jgi:2-polyprenyl-3-methyl-5-hydroxy-6-metoxy-1,4-benzoquinol methylase
LGENSALCACRIFLFLEGVEMKVKEVIDYYNSYDEEIRLNKSNVHKLEYLTTIKYIEKVMPPKSKILDVGAGTGAYAFYFANKGFPVIAGDIVPKLVDIMREKVANTTLDMKIHLWDARDLSMLDSGKFDVVLCMGPLYHLKGEKDRSKVIGQCLRVLKDGGIIVSAYINRFAAYLLEFSSSDDLARDEIILNDTLSLGHTIKEKLSSFYFSSPEEIETLMEKHKIEKIASIGTDGIAYMLGSKINNLKEQEYNYWVNYHLETCENKHLIGYSLHGLYIGRKR